MGTAVHVPETRDMIGEELSGDEAYTALRRYGGLRLLADSFARFRYADGFTNARALAFQMVLGLVPCLVVLVGLATSVHTEGAGRVIELTLSRIVPGASEEVVEEVFDTTRHTAGGDMWGALALWLGLGFALLNLASAMGQIERGANRIYGIERDRPALRKYGRAMALAFAAGMPLVLGFVVLVAGAAVGEAVADFSGGGWAGGPRWWDVLDVPVGLALAWVASAVIFRWSPRRVQPGYTWLAFGSAVHLLLWANLTAVALFLGIAFAAQLEAARAGIDRAVRPDPVPDR